jgi:hypothetical protein
MTVMEIGSGNSFSFRPPGKTSQSTPLLAQSTLCVTGGAKMVEEKLNMIVERPLTRPTFQRSCVHVISPCLAYLPA